MRKLIAAFGLTFAALTAQAQSLPSETTSDAPRRVAAFMDWAVFVRDDPHECIATSQASTESGWPEGVAADATSFMMVTFRPARGETPGELSFYTGGRPIAAGTTLGLHVGADQRPLFSDGAWAWPTNAAEDERAIALLRTGETASVSLLSEGMVPVSVSFSLAGFDEAVTRAHDHCTSLAAGA